jgi:hypothetical protein
MLPKFRLLWEIVAELLCLFGLRTCAICREVPVKLERELRPATELDWMRFRKGKVR